MEQILVNGVYDEVTLQTLLSNGITGIGFDLRSRSSDLITFKQLKHLLANYSISKKILIFENEKAEVIHSSLDLLKQFSKSFILEFRDYLPASWYAQFNFPFYWMFNPHADWKAIVQNEMMIGILLPLEWQGHYQALPELWEVIEQRHLEIYLHANNFAEAEKLKNNVKVNISVDLTGQFLKGPRFIDQERLQQHVFWR
jgi:hypothetical protein